MVKDSKDHSWGIAENSSEVSGSENLKCITTCPLHHVVLGGLQEKLSYLIQKQTPTYSVIGHNWNFKRDWLLWSDETKKYILFSSKLS